MRQILSIALLIICLLSRLSNNQIIIHLHDGPLVLLQNHNNQYYQPLLFSKNATISKDTDSIIDSEGFLKEDALALVHQVFSENGRIECMHINMSRIVTINNLGNNSVIQVAKWNGLNYVIKTSGMFPSHVYLESSPFDEDCFFIQLMMDPDVDGFDVLFLVFSYNDEANDWMLDYYTDSKDFIATFSGTYFDVVDFHTEEHIINYPLDGVLSRLKWQDLYRVYDSVERWKVRQCIDDTI